MRREAFAIVVLLEVGCSGQPPLHLTLGADCSPKICFVQGDAGCVWAVPECCDAVTPACPRVELDGVTRQLELQAVDAGRCMNVNVVGCL